jgi:formyltetrahydrofolate-dependent phosphoribosylglycinamide formyltransferase
MWIPLLLPLLCIFVFMLKRLREKWRVNNRDLFLILCTFAITGTLTAYLTKEITSWLQLERFSFSWWMLKVGVLLIGYWILLIIVGSFFGQFNFFWSFEKKLLRRIGLMKDVSTSDLTRKSATHSAAASKMYRIAIFASGKGSNAKRIIEHFRNSKLAQVVLIASDKPEAGVLDIGRKERIDTIVLEKKKFFQGDHYMPELREYGIDLIVLAGFMRMIPWAMVAVYRNKIVNIHPALLPKYGGKGMYGEHVHIAVLAAGEKESGITIHYVDEVYDNGDVIFQVKCEVKEDDTPQSLAARIHELEHYHYPRVLEVLLK